MLLHDQTIQQGKGLLKGAHTLAEQWPEARELSALIALHNSG